MAKKTRGVWGIDIGQTAIKALRCHLDENNDVVADSFDFIEYPKILSMPDADEESLVNEALETFLNRNDIRGDFVGMTVSGQSGLSRFFKPPPVDARTLPEIVKYEVRQQIPFPIEDVIWDWQTLGGSEMDGVLVDAEVGLFAIKRDTVFTALQPFLKKDVEVDLVQLSPLATHNVVCREVLDEIPEDVDPDTLNECVVILSMGTDATDLIVTNGVRLWLRNIPIGGNHFTKELSRELKLTHAKAEQLKRNARQAEDPKTVFQAMRRVFNDLKKEVERSLSFYGGIDKHSKLERIVLLGNAAQLPGLRQFLNKQLEMDIVKLNDFPGLKGSVIDERAFQENMLSFAPAYGLCLQGLKKAAINTNLLPVEFVNERIIRAKKPWVLASVSLLMLGMLFSYFFVNQRWWAVNENYKTNGTSWKAAIADVTAKGSRSADYMATDEEQRVILDQINAISLELVEASETRASWAEILSAISQLLPRDPRMFSEDGKLELAVDPDTIPFEDRQEVYLSHLETKFFDDLTNWVTNEVYAAFLEQRGDFEALDKVVEKAAKSKSKKKISLATDYNVSGPGWVVELKGYHFFNSEKQRLVSLHGLEFVRKFVLDSLVHSTVKLPNKDGVIEEYKLEDIGIYYPTMVSDKSKTVDVEIRNPKFGRQGKDRSDDPAVPPDTSDESKDDPAVPPDTSDESKDESGKGPETKSESPEFFAVKRFDFTIQMACIPVSAAKRDSNKAARIKKEKELEKLTPAEPGTEEVPVPGAGG